MTQCFKCKKEFADEGYTFKGLDFCSWSCKFDYCDDLLVKKYVEAIAKMPDPTESDKKQSMKLKTNLVVEE